MILVPMRRLKKVLISDLDGFVWNDGDEPITIEEVRGYKGRSEPRPFGGTDFFAIKPRKRDFHLRRVVYFYRNPNEIRGIKLGDHDWHDRYRYYSFPGVTIEDGYHRMLAALSLGLEEVSVDYVGVRTDNLNYLKGIRRKIPTKEMCF